MVSVLARRRRRGTAIDAASAEFDLAHLAAGPIVSFDDDHVETARRQGKRCAQSGDSRTDDDNLAALHRRPQTICLRNENICLV